ncbi:Coproporphyrinogen oxidase [Anaeromyxobacter sp. K]|nr:oxygen-dependent coproporphyrinogen oxidase [Anaeromyxobacter sp. K]ACG73092.1 Coproporphyrinogen oxidase [Anaeromyxobacter sp. K]
MPTPASPELLARLRAGMAETVRALQEEICAALERADGAARFAADPWERPGGGGGESRVLQDGAVLEKAGVNVSEVHGELPDALARKVQGEGGAFTAVGLSVVVHPASPMAPTAHMNVRLLSRGGGAWFGGGADLTPYYLFEEDCRHFHAVLRDACERHAPGSYARHKRAADAYFYLRHRGEHRGVGGIFYEDAGDDLERELAFAGEMGRAFLRAYLPILERRRAAPFGEAERRWQEIRRGRYVEFNLVWDRGTVFGLETSGRTESILMSLPPRVRWVYDHRPAPGSREAALLDVLRAPRDWA